MGRYLQGLGTLAEVGHWMGDHLNLQKCLYASKSIIDRRYGSSETNKLYQATHFLHVKYWYVVASDLVGSRPQHIWEKPKQIDW